MFDMMLAVAEELIPTATTDRIGTGTACPGATLFNADNTCNADGFACLLGSPLTTVQLTGVQQRRQADRIAHQQRHHARQADDRRNHRFVCLSL